MTLYVSSIFIKTCDLTRSGSVILLCFFTNLFFYTYWLQCTTGRFHITCFSARSATLQLRVNFGKLPMAPYSSRFTTVFFHQLDLLHVLVPRHCRCIPHNLLFCTYWFQDTTGVFHITCFYARSGSKTLRGDST